MCFWSSIMGFLFDMPKNGGGVGGLRSLVRRKRVDSAHSKSSPVSWTGHYQLAKALTVPHLIVIGNKEIVGCTIRSRRYLDHLILSLCHKEILFYCILFTSTCLY